ncbi:MAG: response regulator, partial [Bacteroidetes bacterium]|nr:response regulator [Bacteroidota bacterium]
MGTAQKKKILVLDDEEALRVVLAAELEDQGYEAFALEDKTEGYEWTLQHRPDLIISDIKSPGMDGFELLLLFVTGYSSLAVAIESKKLGAADFVTKPYEFLELFATVERIFRKDNHPPIYHPDDSDIPLFERGNILHAPWMKILRTFERGLIRVG